MSADHTTFENQQNAMAILAKLNQQRIEGDECDFELGDEKHSCRFHRCLLRAVSPVVDDACRQHAGLDRFLIKGISASALETFLLYLYTTALTINCDIVLDLLRIGHLLQIPYLVDSCMTFIGRKITTSDFSFYLNFAIENGFEDLRRLCRTFCSEHYEDLIKGEQYLNIKPEDFTKILSHPDLYAKDEESVFDSICRWLFRDQAERLTYGEQLSTTVRYQLINVKRLISILQCSDLRFAHDHVRIALIDIGVLAGQMARNRWERRIRGTDKGPGMCGELASDNEEIEDFRVPMLPSEMSKTGNLLAVLGGRSEDKKALKDILCYQVKIGFESQDPQQLPEDCQTISGDKQTSRDAAYEPRRIDIELLPSHPINSMPSNRRGFGAAVLWNQMFVFGGRPADAMQTVHVCDIVSGEWMAGPSLLHGRSWFGVGHTDSLIYAVGGSSTNGQPLSTIEQLDIRVGAWKLVPCMPHPRMSLSVAVLDRTLYVIGGHEDSSCDCFDITAGKWMEVTPLELVHEACGAISYNNQLYVFGGTGPFGSMSCVERYTPIDNRWEVMNPMPLPRAFSAVATIDDHIMVIGGRNEDSACRAVQLYQVNRDAWTVVSDVLPTGRSSFCAVCLPA